MQHIVVGQPLHQLVNQPEGASLTLDGSGLLLAITFQGVKPTEIEQMQTGVSAELRFSVLSGVLFMHAKFGDLAWIDAPFFSATSTPVPIPVPTGTEGLALTVILADAPSGTVKGVRLLGLGTSFSLPLLGAIAEVVRAGMPKQAQLQTIQQLYAKYTTKQMIGYAVGRYKVTD